MKRTELRRKTPMKPAKARRKKTPLRVICDRCDLKWALLVKHRAGWCCEADGCNEQVRLHAHHVRPRSIARLRWTPENGTALCARHHLWWAHKDVLAFAAWFRTHRFDDYQALVKPEAIAPFHKTVPVMEGIEAMLDAELGRYAEAA